MSQATQPCPLGSACPDGGRHRPDSKVYREHAARAAANPSSRKTESKPGSDVRPLRAFGPGSSMSVRPDGTSEVTLNGQTVSVGKEMTRLLKDGAVSEYVPQFNEVGPHLYAGILAGDMEAAGFNMVIAEMAAESVSMDINEERLADFVGDEIKKVRRFQAWSGSDPSPAACAEEMTANYAISALPPQGNQERHNTVVLTGTFNGETRTAMFDFPEELSNLYESDTLGGQALEKAIDDYTKSFMYGGGEGYQYHILEGGGFEFGNGLDDLFEEDSDRAVESFSDDFGAMRERMMESSKNFFADQDKLIAALGR